MYSTGTPIRSQRSAGSGIGPALLAALVFAAACSDPLSRRPGLAEELDCSIPKSLIFDGGVGRDGIPALVDPTFVPPGHPEAAYLRDFDRVISLRIGGEVLAVPHNILWWHEIVNLERGGEAVAVSYCPLTGSSMTFDRSGVGGAEFGVSGLLFNNNLVMYDRTATFSLWPQMMGEARCGVKDGAVLAMAPSAEVEWGRWKELHPDGKVISAETGILRNYQRYPYGNYEALHNRETLYPQPGMDDRRPPKERILGIPEGGTGGLAFPFLLLDAVGAIAAVHARVGSRDVVVFWDRAGRSARAFFPRANGGDLSFEVEGARLVDTETGSEWRPDGLATGGPLAGTRLEAVPDAYVAFWFAWAAFRSETELWEGAGS